MTISIFILLLIASFLAFYVEDSELVNSYNIPCVNIERLQLGEDTQFTTFQAAGLWIQVEQTILCFELWVIADINGSQSGIVLKATLTRLSKASKKVAYSLAELGVRAKDPYGRLRTMPNLMEELRKKLKGILKGRQMQYLAIYSLSGSTPNSVPLN